MKRLLLIAALCCLSFRVEASAGFGANYGTGTTDVITTGYSTTPATSYSLSAWFYIHSNGPDTFGVPLTQSSGPNNWGLYMASSSTVMAFQPGWSSQVGEWDTTISDNVWFHFCLTYNGSSTSNNPNIYVNGVLISPTKVHTPSGSLVLVSAPLLIGNGATGANIDDGKVAEVSFYNGVLLAASQCKSLAQGTSPLKIGVTPSFYAPLYGNFSSIFSADWSPTHVTQTVTGAKPQVNSPANLYTP
jgi:hypothetical protein